MFSGEGLFAKRCCAHGEQCLCVGVESIAGEGHQSALLAPRPVDPDPSPKTPIILFH